MLSKLREKCIVKVSIILDLLKLRRYGFIFTSLDSCSVHWEVACSLDTSSCLLML